MHDIVQLSYGLHRIHARYIQSKRNGKKKCLMTLFIGRRIWNWHIKFHFMYKKYAGIYPSLFLFMIVPECSFSCYIDSSFLLYNYHFYMP